MAVVEPEINKMTGVIAKRDLQYSHNGSSKISLFTNTFRWHKGKEECGKDHATMS
jgi:hypothetical protein